MSIFAELNGAKHAGLPPPLRMAKGHHKIKPCFLLASFFVDAHTTSNQSHTYLESSPAALEANGIFLGYRGFQGVPHLVDNPELGQAPGAADERRFAPRSCSRRYHLLHFFLILPHLGPVANKIPVSSPREGYLRQRTAEFVPIADAVVLDHVLHRPVSPGDRLAFYRAVLCASSSSSFSGTNEML